MPYCRRLRVLLGRTIVTWSRKFMIANGPRVQCTYFRKTGRWKRGAKQPRNVQFPSGRWRKRFFSRCRPLRPRSTLSESQRSHLFAGATSASPADRAPAATRSCGPVTVSPCAGNATGTSGRGRDQVFVFLVGPSIKCVTAPGGRRLRPISSLPNRFRTYDRKIRSGRSRQFTIRSTIFWLGYSSFCRPA